MGRGPWSVVRGPWSVRSIITGAARTYSGHVDAGSPAGGAWVRRGSRWSHTACRVDFHPVSRPCWRGEFAKLALSTGPTEWRSSHRRATSAASVPASRFTCTAAVDAIITGPRSWDSVSK